jgi:intraflagellar transport protein 122
MKTLLLWQDKIQDANGARQPIWDIAYYPDGTRLIATAGTEVLVYKSEGELIQALRSHKDAVFTVNVSADGKRFASGGADKQVIIWDAETFEGILKYSHNDIIQSVSHNPATGQVLSCTPTDFGLWSAEAKSVVKTKVFLRGCLHARPHQRSSHLHGLAMVNSSHSECTTGQSRSVIKTESKQPK